MSAPKSTALRLEVSPELHALVCGFAGFYGQKPEEYVLKALLTMIEADCDGRLDKHLPENHRASG